MDPGTHEFYGAYAEQLRQHPESPRSAMMALAERFFVPSDGVLDVGAGSGRDVIALRSLGIDAVGVEPNDAMRAHAVATHPALAEYLRPGGLPALGQPFADRYPAGFDGVVCSAVLMHIEPAALAQALHALASVLRRERAHGDTARPQQLLLSVPEMAPDRLRDHRDPDGRLFFNHAPQQIIDLLQPQGLTLCAQEVSDVVLATTATRWHSLAFMGRRGIPG